MNRGPKRGTIAVDYFAKARLAWGDPLPPEIEALADACQRSSGRSVAATLGYAPAVISTVLSRTYRGDVPTVLARIRGALLGETVRCPVLGEIRGDRCLTEQKRPFSISNSTRARLFHACRTCPNRQEA